MNFTKKLVPLYIALIGILLLPLFNFFEISLYDQKRLYQSGVLIICSVSFAILLTRYEFRLGNKWNLVIISVVFIILIISSILSPLPQWALLQTAWYLLLFISILLFAHLFQQNRELYIRSTLLILFGLVILYSLRIFIDHFELLFNSHKSVWPSINSHIVEIGGERTNPNPHLGFINRRFFNHIQTWTLPLLILGYLYYKPLLIKGFRILLIFFVSSWWMLVFASDARGTLIASLVSIGIILIIFKKRAFKFCFPYLLTAGAGFILFLLLFYLPDFSGEKGIFRLGDSGRIEAWKFAISQIIDKPLLGLGPMHFSWIEINPPLSTPHNIVLQSISEWGIPAFVFLTALIVCSFYKFIAQSKELQLGYQSDTEICYRISVTASLVGAITHSLVSGIFETPLSQLLAVIVLGWAVGDYFLSKGDKLLMKRERISFKFVLTMLLLLVSVGFVAQKIAFDTANIEETYLCHNEIKSTNKYYPRFWHQGLICNRVVD